MANALIPSKVNLVTESPVSIYDMFNDMFNDMFASPSNRNIARNTFKVDVSESEDGYLVEADLPGVAKDQIDISLEDDRLAISVDYEDKKEESEKNYIHRERRHTSMVRGCYLKNADAGNVSAKLENGVLTIDIPKVAPETNTHKIEID